MEIRVNKNTKLNISMRSKDNLYEVEEFNCEVDYNILVVTSKIKVIIDNTDVELLFEVTSNIDLDEIDDNTYVDLPITDSKFISSNVNPKNLEDIDKIIAASYDCSILGIMDYELSYYIKKDPSILNNLILLIDKANIDHVEYDKNDLKSVFNAYEEVVDGETSDGTITELFYDGMKEVDPTIADKVMMSLQKVVQEEWKPYIGEGLDEALENNITILIEFN